MSVSIADALRPAPAQAPEHDLPRQSFGLPHAYADDGLNRALASDATQDTLRGLFDSAPAFPHLVIDGLFDPGLLEGMARDYDGVRREDWITYESRNERKRGTRPDIALGAASQRYFDLIHRAKFLRFLTRVTGIEGLVTDPVLRGGGLHEIPVGGKFDVHLDFTRHADTLLDNRLVFITYLNKGWQAEWGGALELWGGSAPVGAVVPVFGRSIVFAQGAESFHGHPDPVRTPDGRTRRSAAAYFYTNGRPERTPAERLGTRYLRQAAPPLREQVARAARYVLPPVLWDGLEFVRRRVAAAW